MGRTEAMSTDDEEMQKAEQLAADLVQHVPQTGTLDTFWDLPQVDEALSLLQEAGYAPTDFLPSGGDLSFAGADRAAKFFKRYVRQVHAQICTEDGKARQTVGNAWNAGVGALLPAMVLVVAIPPAAVVVLAPIAAILASVGLDKFCKMSNEPQTSQ
jgi:leucyl aminopeptidase